MIATGAKTHHGSEVVGMMDHLPRAKMISRLSGRNDVADTTVVDIDAVGTPEYMTRTYPGHPAKEVEFVAR
jgi:hypothetical protein